MPKRRDRHQRGMRGPMSVANQITGEPVPLRRRESAAEYFVGSVRESVRRLGRTAPQALANVTIGIEEVPLLGPTWQGEGIPLAAALERTDSAPGRVVLYRRPLELRASSRRELDELVHRTVVEQLAELSGLDATTIDPDYDSEP